LTPDQSINKFSPNQILATNLESEINKNSIECLQLQTWVERNKQLEQLDKFV
jgi:hypothetical protein